MICTYFFPLHGLCFYFPNSVLWRTKFLILMKYIIYPFYSVTSAFGFVSEKPLLTESHNLFLCSPLSFIVLLYFGLWSELTFVYGMKTVQPQSFACDYPVVPAPWVERLFFPPLSFHGTVWTDSKYKSILSLSCLNYNICYLSGIGRRKRQPTPIFLPGKSHGRRAWQATVHRVTELDMTKCVCARSRMHTHTHPYSFVVSPKDNFQRQWIVVFNLFLSSYCFSGEQPTEFLIKGIPQGKSSPCVIYLFYVTC